MQNAKQLNQNSHRQLNFKQARFDLFGMSNCHLETLLV